MSFYFLYLIVVKEREFERLEGKNEMGGVRREGRREESYRSGG